MHRRWSAYCSFALGVSSWVLLGAVAIGMVAYSPFVEEWLLNPSPGIIAVERTILFTTAAAAGIAWVAAFIHVWLTRRDRSSVPTPLLLAMIMVFNFVGAFFYYFLYVYWTSPVSIELTSNS